jgi:hypothetical protein
MLLIVSAEAPVFVRTAGRVCRILLSARLAGTSFTLPVVRVTLAEADFVGSVTEVAITCTSAVAGTEPGAVYVVAASLAVLEGRTLPHSPEHDTSSRESVQLTPLLAVSFPTVAMNSCATLSGINALIGVTDVVTEGIVMLAPPDEDGKVTEVATRLTVNESTGAVAGAV